MNEQLTKGEREILEQLVNISERITSRILAKRLDEKEERVVSIFNSLSQKGLIELKAERKSYVSEAAMILNSIQYSSLRTQGSIVGLILGGYDEKDGFSLYDLGPDGTIVPHE